MTVVSVLDLVLGLEVALEPTCSNGVLSRLASLRALVMLQVIVLVVSLVGCLVSSLCSILAATSVLRSLAISKSRDCLVEVAGCEKMLSWLGEADSIS